jgi:hypothetical protein
LVLSPRVLNIHNLALDLSSFTCKKPLMASDTDKYLASVILLAISSAVGKLYIKWSLKGSDDGAL